MQDQKLEVGAVLSNTTRIISTSAMESALYVLALGGLGTVLDLSGTTATTPYTFASVAGGYLVLHAMLKNMGEATVEGGKRIGAYFGLSILSGLGVLVGLVLLIIPGIVLAVRWLPAYAILLSENTTVTGALSASWDRTRAQVWPLFAAMLLLAVLMAVSLTVLLSSELLAAVPPMVATVAGNLFIAAVSVFGTALGVAVFRGLRPQQELSEVFA